MDNGAGAPDACGGGGCVGFATGAAAGVGGASAAVRPGAAPASSAALTAAGGQALAPFALAEVAA